MPDRDDDHAPSANAFLAALAPEDWNHLRPHLRTVHLERGAVLAEPGAEVTRVYFPLDCLVSQTIPMVDGGVAESYTVGREGAFGLLAALARRPASTRSFVQVAGEAERLPVPVLREVFEASAGLRGACLANAAAQLDQVLQLAACNALHPAEARLARWLLMVQDQVDADTTLPLTHEFLAAMLGVQRPTVTVVARTLQGAGLIRYRRGAVVVLDRAGLEEAACECYAAVRLPQGASPPLPGAWGGAR
jgi:CRP-like cAMP-binding protein